MHHSTIQEGGGGGWGGGGVGAVFDLLQCVSDEDGRFLDGEVADAFFCTQRRGAEARRGGTCISHVRERHLLAPALSRSRTRSATHTTAHA